MPDHTGFVVHTVGLASYAFARWGDAPLRSVQGVTAFGADTLYPVVSAADADGAEAKR